VAFRPRLEGLEDRTVPSVVTGNAPSSIAYTDSGFYAAHQETVSSNGQFAVFTSSAGNLVSGVTISGNGDVYRRDLVNGTTSLVSISSDGKSDVSLGSFADEPSITPDGRYVAFASDSPYLPSNSNGTTEVFVRDMQQGQTYLVSLGKDTLGNPTPANLGAVKPTIAETSNGQLVIAYQSHSTNLTASDTNSSSDQIFVTTFNLDAGGNIVYNTLATKLATATSTGNGGNGESDDAMLSKDGSTLAFETFATNLPGEKLDTADGHQHVQVFTYNVASGVLTQVSPAPPAGQTTDSSWLSSISDNGQYLAYDYLNHNTGVGQVLAWNANTRTNTVVYTSTGAVYPAQYTTVISGDGSTIAITAGNAYGRGVIYATSNWQTGSPTLLQVTPTPNNPVFSSHLPSISYNGKVIAYDLSPTFTADQAYVWNNGTTIEASAAFTGGDSNGAANTPVVSADGSTVLFNSTANNLISGMFDIAGEENVFAYNVNNRTISLVSAQPSGVVPAGTVVVSAPSSATAGSSFNVTITNTNPSGYTYNGPVSLTTSDGEVVAQPPPMVNGSTTVGVVLDKAGTITLTASAGSLTGSTPITINPAAMSRLAISAPSSVTAGSPVTVTVTAQDTFGNTVTSESGTVTLSSTDGQIPRTSLTLSKGVATTQVTLDKAEQLYLDATLVASNGTWSVQSGLITVKAAAMTVSFTPFNPSAVSAGGTFTSTITIKDKYGNGYNGTVSLSSSDGQKLNVPSFTMAGGSTLVGFQLYKADTITLTATAGSLTGISNAITISPATVAKLAVSAPSSVTAGSPVSVTVTAEDAWGNTVTSQSGSFTLKATDGQTVSPASITLSNGVGTAMVTLDKAEQLYLVASNGTISGESALITVKAAAMTVSFTPFNPSAVTAGGTFTSTITIKDKYGNGYNGTVSLSASDGQKLNVPSFTMAGGSTLVGFQLYKADTITLTATAGSLTGTSNTITISPASVAKLAVSAPSSATAGSPVSVTVTAEDAWGNMVTGFNGAVTLSATDGQIPPSSLTLSHGMASTQVTLDKAEQLYLVASNGTIGGESGLITVSPAAMTVVISAPSTVKAGVLFYATITIKDAYGNGYNGTVHLTTSDGQTINVPSFTMSGGSTTVGIVLSTRDTLYLTATAGALKGNSTLFTVG
jgi:hypothetical protein